MEPQSPCDRSVKEWARLIRCKSDFLDYEKNATVSLVTSLDDRINEPDSFFNSLISQSFEGHIELIIIDNSSSSLNTERIQTLHNAATHTKLRLRVTRNSEKSCHCQSKNIGVRLARGSLIIFVDGDSILCKDFVRNHFFVQRFFKDQVVMSPRVQGYPTEFSSRVYPFQNTNLQNINAKAFLHDRTCLESFINLGACDFSVSSQIIREYSFDVDFNDLVDILPEFRLDVIEMGYRMYMSGITTKYLPLAWSLHAKNLNSSIHLADSDIFLLALDRFCKKHPDIPRVLRRWLSSVSQESPRGLSYPDAVRPVPRNDSSLNILCGQSVSVKKSLRILTFRWHCSHQYELYKLPHSFTLVYGLSPGIQNSWDLDQRPLPSNARFKHFMQINTKDYDIAILHFDENVLAYWNTNGVLGRQWGSMFRWFVRSVNLPKIAVCHGTPQFYGQYAEQQVSYDKITVIESSRKQLVDYLADILVICNSHQAKKEWNFKFSKVIWHGFDPVEFAPSSYNKGILSLGSAMHHRPIYRGYSLYKDVSARLPKHYLPETLLVPQPPKELSRNSNIYSAQRFYNYVNSIRQYSIYFNPTWRSPMPRSRGEAMMCGLVPVSAHNHDVDLFIEQGKNGFYSNDPEELANILIFLLKKPNVCKKIGRAARWTAMDVFNHDRYLAEWQSLLKELS